MCATAPMQASQLLLKYYYIYLSVEAGTRKDP